MAPTVVDAAEIHRAVRRNAADEIALHRHVVGVVRLTGARARHEIAGGEVVDALADRDDFAGRANSRRPIPARRARSAAGRRSSAAPCRRRRSTASRAIVLARPAVVTTTVTSRGARRDRTISVSSNGPASYVREPSQASRPVVQQTDRNRALVDASRARARPAPDPSGTAIGCDMI